MTPPCTSLRRGCLGDKARSKSNISSARRATVAARSAAIPACSITPLPLYTVVAGHLGTLLVATTTETRSFSSLSLPSTPRPFPCGISALEPAPIRTFEDGAPILAAIRCGMRDSLLLLYCSQLLPLWCVLCWSAPCVCDSQQQNSLENVVASSLHSALKGTRGSRTNAKNSDSRFGRKT